MKKSLFFLTSLFFLFSSTPAFACSMNLILASSVFFIMPIIVGLITFYSNKKTQKTVSFYHFIDNTLSKTSLTLGIISLLRFLTEPEFCIALSFIFILYAFTNSINIPENSTSRIKEKLMKIWKLSAQIMILLSFSIILTFTTCETMLPR